MKGLVRFIAVKENSKKLIYASAKLINIHGTIKTYLF